MEQQIPIPPEGGGGGLGFPFTLSKIVGHPKMNWHILSIISSYRTSIPVRLLLNRKYEELSHNKNQKMYNPILVTLLKMQPH